MNDAWQAMEGHRARVAQVDENSARLAWVLAEYTTTGTGQLVEEKVFDFDLAFIERPIFNFGASLGDDVDVPDTLADLPVCRATVYDWRVADGLYTGAYCYFTVSAGASVVAANLTVIFGLTWVGVASKNILQSDGFNLAALEL